MICTKFSCRIAAMCGSVLQSVGFILTGFAPNLYVVFFSFGIVVGMSAAAWFTEDVFYSYII